MNKIKITLSAVLIFLFSFSPVSAAINIVPNGGTGVGTITGIIQGNGTSAFSAITVASTLSFSGGSLAIDLSHANTWTGQQIFNTTAPKLGTITGSTQCLHVDTTGLISGTGSDCGSGSGSGTVTSVDTTTASNGITATWANTTTAARLTIAQASATPNTLIASDATTPHVDTTAGSTNTGYFLVNGKTSGSLKITAADATVQAITLKTAAQTVGAATLTIPDMANTNKTIAWLESPVFTTPNIGSATGSVSGNAGTATALATGRTIAITGDVTYTSGSFDGTGNVTGAGTIANSAVTLAKMANMATSSLIYRKTAGAGAPEVNTLATLKTDLGLTGTNSGDQTISLTGDVTGSGTGSFAATIANSAVTLAKMANMATASILGRNTAGSGAPEVLSAATTKSILSLNNVENTALSTWAGSSNITTVGTLASPTLTTPVINGLATGTGVASAATVSTIATRDANGNLSNVNLIDGWRTQATAGATTTLVVGDGYQQYFTGTLAQTVKLPTTGIVAGQQYQIVNNSTGLVTVQSSGANTITILGASTSAVFTALVATPTTAANWGSSYSGVNTASGKVATINNTITLAGTDAQTYTFPTTSATIARTDAANTFTGHQTIEGVTSTGATGTGLLVFGTSPTFVTPILGTPTSGTLTNATGLPEAGLTLADNTTANASTSAHGFLKKLDNTATHYMDGTGAWSTPPGAAFSAQDVPLITGTTAFTKVNTTSNSTGTVLFVAMFSASGSPIQLFRLAKDATTGNYYQTHTTSITTVSTSAFGGMAVLGSNLYISFSSSNAGKLDRFVAADLTGVTAMTISGTNSFANGGALWADSTQLYNYNGTADTFQIYTVSGTTATSGSTVSFTTSGNPSTASVSDGTNVWITDNTSSGTVSIRKYPIAGGAVTSTTSPIIQYGIYPNGAPIGLFLGSASVLGIAWSKTVESNLAVKGTAAQLLGIALP